MEQTSKEFFNAAFIEIYANLISEKFKHTSGDCTFPETVTAKGIAVRALSLTKALVEVRFSAQYQKDM